MLAGAIQGMIFVLAVATSKKYRSRSTNFLLALILVFSVDLFQYYLNDAEIFSLEEFHQFIYLPLASSAGVFLYLYVFTLLYPEEKISRKQWLFFLPFVLFFTTMVLLKIIIFFLPEEKQIPLVSFYWSVYDLQEITAAIMSVFMSILAFREIQKFERRNENNQHKLHLTWLKATILFLIFFICTSWIWLSYLDMYEKEEPKFYLLWIGMSVTIYWLGHIGIYKFGIQSEREQIRKFTSTLTTVEPQPKEIHLKKSKQLDLFEEYILQQRNFLDPLLSLEKSAEHLGVNKTYLSRILNQELNISFNDYINNLRVEEAKKILEQPEFENYTLSAIGLEAGFNSKSTFYTAFKKFTEMSPSDYRNQKKLSADFERNTTDSGKI